MEKLTRPDFLAQKRSAQIAGSCSWPIVEVNVCVAVLETSMDPVGVTIEDVLPHHTIGLCQCLASRRVGNYGCSSRALCVWIPKFLDGSCAYMQE